jgi:hypothetical protein
VALLPVLLCSGGRALLACRLIRRHARKRRDSPGI